MRTKEPLTWQDKVVVGVFWGSIALTLVLTLGNVVGVWTLSWWLVISPVLAMVGLILLIIVFLFLVVLFINWQIGRGNG